MATVVRLQRNDPWAGFGEAFTRSFAQSREHANQTAARTQALENQKALERYRMELEQKQYSADAAQLQTLAGISSQVAPVSTKVAQEGRDSMMQQLLEPTTQTDAAGKAQETYIGDRVLNLPPETAKWLASKEARGQTVRFDPTTGRPMIVNAQVATGMDTAGVSRQKGILEIQQKRLALEKQQQDAETNKQFYEVFRPQRIEDIKKMILTDSRFDGYLPKDSKGKPVKEEASAKALAQELFDSNRGFATFMLSLDGKDDVYIKADADMNNLQDSDYSMTKRPGYLKASLYMQKQNIALGIKKIAAAEKEDKAKPRSFRTPEEKRQAYITAQGIDAKRPDLAASTANGQRLEHWRAFTGFAEETATSRLDRRIQSAFFISGEGKDYAAAKTLSPRFQTDLRKALQTYLGQLSTVVADNPEVRDGFILGPENVMAAMEDVYKREFGKIASQEAGSKAYNEALKTYQKREATGEFYKEAVKRLGQDADFGLRLPKPKVSIESQVGATLQACAMLGIDCNNIADPKVQNVLKRMQDKYYANDPAGYKVYRESLTAELQKTQQAGAGISLNSIPPLVAQ